VVSKAQLPYVLEQATVISYDPRDPRSIAIRTSGGRVIRNCMSSGGSVSVGSTVMAVISHYDNGAVIIGTVQNSSSIAAAGTSCSNAALNPPSGLHITHTVRQIDLQWDFYPGNDSVCYQVQHNATGEEDGTEVSALVTKGSSFIYDCTTPNETRYFRVRALQWITAGNVLYSAWAEWQQGSAYQLQAVDIPNLDAAKIATGILPIERGGTNAGTAAAALNNLLPAQSGNTGNVLGTDGSVVSWVVGGGSGGGSITIANLPVGVIIPYGSTIMPTGWLECDGSAISRTTYADLFAVIGTTYGSGDGSTTFNLPDLRGRMSIGRGTGSGLSVRAMGDKNGDETHTLSVAEMPAHGHGEVDKDGVPVSSGKFPGTGAMTIGTVSADPEGQPMTSNTGGGGAHNNMPPFVVMAWIIKHTDTATADVIFNDSVLPEAVADVGSPGDDIYAARRDHVHASSIGGGHAIASEFDLVPPEPILNFSAAFMLDDDPVNGRTLVDLARPPLTVEEVDGSPSVSVLRVRVGNGDLVDEGDGVVRLKTASDASGVAATGRYRQFVFVVSDGDFSFVKITDGHPVTVLLPLE